MSADKGLYIWLEGDIETPLEILVAAADEMPLTAFRDAFVDTSRGHVVARIFDVHDAAGNAYRVTLEPIADEASSAATSLTLVKGIGVKTAQTLQHQADVHSLEDLLERGATSAGRQELAQAVGKSAEVILHWVELADLMRIVGAGENYAELLWQANINSVPELAEQNPMTFPKLLQNANQRLDVVNRLPSEKAIQDWISQAKTLPALVSAE